MCRTYGVREFDSVFVFDYRVLDSGVADKVARVARVEDPESEIVEAPVFGGALKKCASLILSEDVAISRERRHHARIVVQGADFREVARLHWRADQARGGNLLHARLALITRITLCGRSLGRPLLRASRLRRAC